MSTFRANPVCKNNSSTFNNSLQLPESIRGLLIGASNSGKTFLLFQMLLEDGFLDYNNLLIFSKSLHQKEYQMIIQGFKHKLTKAQIDKLFDVYNNIPKDENVSINTLCELTSKLPGEEGDITVSAYKNNIDVPDPSSLDCNKKNLIIFDDVLLDKQRIMEEYYTKGRHNSTQAFYISQSFFVLPKGSIRDNANLLILFELDDINIQNIHRQIVSKDMDLDTFRKFCKKVWVKKHKYMVIDRFNDDVNWKYRDGFDIPLNKVLPHINECL